MPLAALVAIAQAAAAWRSDAHDHHNHLIKPRLQDAGSQVLGSAVASSVKAVRGPALETRGFYNQLVTLITEFNQRAAHQFKTRPTQS